MWEPAWDLWALLALGAFAWFWYDSLRARERAVALGRTACERDRLQFLDDTVECVRTRPARDDQGRMVLRRIYRFEFSDNGNNRRQGEIVMLGTQVESLTMEPFLLL
ncbi:MAG: DUF3301 domain-containing protein [Betaproteobacteria bacterium]|nr:DUF3301 domain-containing protein [Betaproteobacteria bacterium]